MLRQRRRRRGLDVQRLERGVEQVLRRRGRAREVLVLEARRALERRRFRIQRSAATDLLDQRG